MNKNNLISRKLPNNQKIMKVPINKNAVPNVSKPLDKTSRNGSIAPDHMNENSLVFCNTLPPAPRSQIVNYPERKPNCTPINPIPYIKDSCYLINNHSQGVVGLVCNNAGGSNNSNFTRGNEFGQDYKWINQYSYENSKKKEYTIERPVRQSLEMSNPIIEYSDSNFYPTNTFSNRKYPWYRTYPSFKNYTAEGIPIYTYPYKTLNPPKGNNVIENFDNMLNPKNSIIFPIMVVIIIMIIFYYLK